MSYEPKGIRFIDMASKKYMLLVDDGEPSFAGWLCYRHPDGHWVTLRRASQDDRQRIANAQSAFVALPKITLPSGDCMENNDLLNAVKDGIREGVKQKLGTHSYGSNPVDKAIEAAVNEHAPAIKTLMNECFVAAMQDKDFREEIRVGVRKKLGALLVSKFGGELEKQVNVLKSDPVTRAEIVLAIDKIVKSRLETVQ